MTLNTIIEEEKKAFEKRFPKTEEEKHGRAEYVTWMYKDFLTTAMQRAYEAGRQSVDISKDV